MEVLLSRVTQQAVQYAIRSGISITTGFALQQCHQLLKNAPKGEDREEFANLQSRLESKIRIVSPSIDMIELIAARGNTSLESALSLTRDIHNDIQQLGVRILDATDDGQSLQPNKWLSCSRTETKQRIKEIAAQMRRLLTKIEDAVPMINLAIATSGVSLSSKLSGTISPSRMLQASTFLTAADSNFALDPLSRHQVGPTFKLSLYMLFVGHSSRQIVETGARQATWKEVIHKAQMKLWRVPLSQLYDLPGEVQASGGTSRGFLPAVAKAGEYAYQLVIVEDLDDDRMHESEKEGSESCSFDDVFQAGIRDLVPVHEISKIFYADTGKLLNIRDDDDITKPVLLIRRDVHAKPPRRMFTASSSCSHGSARPTPHNSVPDVSHTDEKVQQGVSQEGSAYVEKGFIAPDAALRLPAHLDPEWLAFEVFCDEDTINDDRDIFSDSSSDSSPSFAPSDGMENMLASLKLSASTASSPSRLPRDQASQVLQASKAKRSDPSIKTSLSLLEMILKMASLQQFRQESHLAIEDELLNFFLEDSATAGSGDNKEHRRRVRMDATRRVGFDPYDESPIKRRGEAYIQSTRGEASPRPIFGAASHEGLVSDEGHDFYAPASRTSPPISTPIHTVTSPGPKTPLFQESFHQSAFSQSPLRSRCSDTSDGRSSPVIIRKHDALELIAQRYGP